MSTKAIIAGAAGLAAGVLGLFWYRSSTRKDASCDERIASAAQEDSKLPNDEKSLTQCLNDFFPQVVADFVDHCKNVHDMPPFAQERIRQMLEYTCTGGKLWRGTLVLSTVRDLVATGKFGTLAGKVEKAKVLAWCIEILQACFLVADDIMDASTTRRGQPCWYKLPDVGMDAVNDALILESFIWFLLRKYFGDSSLYVPLVQLFQEVSLQTQLGQLLDTQNDPKGQKRPDLLKRFDLDLYRKIVHNKTAYYTFYLSIASGMIVCGMTSADQMKAARKIAVELGEKFQIEDDYLDCYADPKVLGKEGTDIQDNKCTWLVVQALRLCTPQQFAQLQDWYGDKDPARIANVKKLYTDLGLPAIYEKQEEDSYARIKQLMESSAHLVPPSVFQPILDKIHKRPK